MQNIVLSFSEFERDMIIQRTQEGKAIARRNPNFRDGRPKKFSKTQINHALELLQTHSYKQVIAMTEISRAPLGREKAKRKIENIYVAIAYFLILRSYFNFVPLFFHTIPVYLYIFLLLSVLSYAVY